MITGYYMLHHVDIYPIGWLGLAALMWAPQLLIVTIAAALLMFISRRCRARLATRAFGFVAVLTAIMALWPTFSDWQRARHYNVPVSISSIIMAQKQPFDGRFYHGAPFTERTVTYGTASDGSRLLVDVWRAKGVPEGNLRPAIVRIHGGGWIYGARGDLPLWREWLNELGYEVFEVDYRMPPKAASVLEGLGDVKCAIGWVLLNASKYNIDTNRISLMGNSAGGHLALLAAYSMGDPALPSSCEAPEAKIRSVVNIYGGADIGLLYRTTGSPGLGRLIADAYGGGSPAAFALKVPSPLNHIKAQSPPTITVQGEADRICPVEQAAVLDKALTAVGVYHETYYFPWADHAYDANWDGIATQISRNKIKAFLQKHG
jgi:acetyl esterase/lipase